MPHFFVPPANIRGNAFILTGDEVRHLVTVRRCTVGTELRLFDGTGKTYRARIDAISKDELSGTILEEVTAPRGPLELNVFCAVPKGDRFDWLVEKAAELVGASVVPVVTARSVIKDISPSKLERWQRLALAACQQCRRADLMSIRQPLGFVQAVEGVARDACNIIPWEGEESRSIGMVCRTRQPIRSANVFIGPEGGLSGDEVQHAESCGITPVTMGERILRVETAALVTGIKKAGYAGAAVIALIWAFIIYLILKNFVL
jgi:16S rRNA (uracil1498-N3)-methyltransferase